MENSPQDRGPRDDATPEEIQARRAAALAALPRIGTSPIHTPARFLHNLEEMALALGDLVAAGEAVRDPNVWQWQSVLDDALDALDAWRDHGFSLKAP